MLDGGSRGLRTGGWGGTAGPQCWQLPGLALGHVAEHPLQARYLPLPPAQASTNVNQHAAGPHAAVAAQVLVNLLHPGHGDAACSSGERYRARGRVVGWLGAPTATRAPARHAACDARTWHDRPCSAKRACHLQAPLTVDALHPLAAPQLVLRANMAGRGSRRARASGISNTRSQQPAQRTSMLCITLYRLSIRFLASIAVAMAAIRPVGRLSRSGRKRSVGQGPSSWCGPACRRPGQCFGRRGVRRRLWHDSDVERAVGPAVVGAELTSCSPIGVPS